MPDEQCGMAYLTLCRDMPLACVMRERLHIPIH